MQENAAENILQFQARKEIVYLYKKYLTALEDIRDDHFFMLEKLKQSLPEQYHIIIDAVNYMDENKFALWRKRTLDAGNDSIRNLEEQVAKFKISFK